MSLVFLISLELSLDFLKMGILIWVVAEEMVVEFNVVEIEKELNNTDFRRNSRTTLFLPYLTNYDNHHLNKILLVEEAASKDQTQAAKAVNKSNCHYLEDDPYQTNFLFPID